MFLKQLFSFARVVAALAVACSFSTALQAQSGHLNPVVAKLAQGKVVVGAGTGDLSLDNAHAIARSNLDFVRLEMEHGPLDIEKVYTFLNEMVDRASFRKNNGAITVAP